MSACRCGEASESVGRWSDVAETCGCTGQRRTCPHGNVIEVVYQRMCEPHDKAWRFQFGSTNLVRRTS